MPLEFLRTRGHLPAPRAWRRPGDGLLCSEPTPLAPVHAGAGDRWLVRIGIISDIHANLVALDAVLAALSEADCDEILCGGDVVGYGPRPRECMAAIRERGIPCVQGNHDEWVANGAREWGIREDARRALNWTAGVLGDDELEWLRRLPRLLRHDGIEVVHASHGWRGRWPYVLDDRRLVANFLFQRSDCTFHGHTHVPLVGVHETGSQPRFRQLRDLHLTPDCRCLVNVGSVGQPRDGNPLASCVVFESKTRRVRPMRVPYDIAETQRQMEAVSLPERLVSRLAEGR